MAETDPNIISSAHAKSIQTFNFLHQAINVAHQPALSQLSLFNYAPPLVEAQDFKDIKRANDELAHHLLASGEHAVATLADTKLYLGGRVNVAASPLAAVEVAHRVAFFLKQLGKPSANQSGTSGNQYSFHVSKFSNLAG